MIKIAICDDDKQFTGVIDMMLDGIAKDQSIKISRDAFFDGATFIETIQKGIYYDLIYMDIEMKTINGIQVAKVIREMNIPALIVYVSSYEKYLKDLFDTEPFRFLNKPVDVDTFETVFWAAYKKIRQSAEYYSFTYNKEVIKIPLQNICYFESHSRVILIHLIGKMKNEVSESNNPKDRFYGKMSDVEDKLNNSNCRFLRIHQSFLVNFDYIKSMNFTVANMTDGTVLQISEDRQKAVRTQFCTMAGMET